MSRPAKQAAHEAADQLPGRYDFVAPAKVVFGWGRRVEVGPLARTLGTRAFIVCGSQTLADHGVVDELSHELRAAGVDSVPLTTIRREPLVEDVDQASHRLREHSAKTGDLILALGGGSAIDLAKAAAAMCMQQKSASVREYLEGVGSGLKLAARPLPILAMPTTGGTGSEATKNAVISSQAEKFKKSLRSEDLLPRIVLVDPELAVGVSPSTTAHSGMDCITQLVESYLCRHVRPLPRALAVDGLRYALPALELAVHDGANRAAREAMAHAALLSGMALANSGLGMAHGVGAALGVHCNVPHGLACAVMLPVALRTNRSACLADLAMLARQALGVSELSDERAADTLIHHIDELARTIGIRVRLSDLGVHRDQIPELVVGSRGNSMSANPRDISDQELTRILESMI